MNRKTGYRSAGLRRRVERRGASAPTRRRFLLAAAAWPLVTIVQTVRAQPKQAPVLIGWFEVGSRKTSEHHLTAFKESFSALGWKEGLDFRLEERWADGRMERLQTLAGELAATKPALIVAAPSGAVRAAAKAAPTTPIVQANGDPLAAGLVTSLARPGGMITGVSNVNVDINEKLLELLLVAAPKLRRVGFLVDPTVAAYGATVRAAKRSIEHHRVKRTSPRRLGRRTSSLPSRAWRRMARRLSSS